MRTRLKFQLCYPWLLSCAVVALFGWFAAATAQDEAVYSQTAQGAAGDIIQPFDRLEINVKGEPQLSDVFSVGPAGTIEYPLLGEMDVTGRTAESLAQEIQDLLGVFIRNPQITIARLEQQRLATGTDRQGLGITGSYSVYIMGAVHHPGAYYLREPINALQLIVRSGGLEGVETVSYLGGDVSVIPDLSGVIVISESGGVERLNLSSWQTGQLNLEPLSPGDTVIIPGQRAGTVSVYGEVEVQGVYEFGQPVLLTEVLARAGGVIHRYANLEDVQILRGDPKNPQAFHINLEQAMKKKEMDLLPQVYPGDTVYVPRNFLAKWLDFVDIVRGAESVTQDADNITDILRGKEVTRN